MFIAAQFTITWKWKQPRCLLADEWIRKLWYIYSSGILLSYKRNTFESVLMRQMNLKPIIQTEVSQKEKDKYHILTHIYGLIYDICFSLCDLLHSVKQALVSSTSLELTQICSFVWLSNIPLCICTHLLYPFICRWTSRLRPCPGYCK